MQATTGARAGSDGPSGPVGGDGRSGEAREAQAGSAPDERFGVEQFVCEPQRRRVGRIVAIHRPAPVLYGIQIPNGSTSYAYDRDVRPATEAEVAAYREAVNKWRGIRESRTP